MCGNWFKDYVHMGKFRGDDESIVAQQCSACGANSLLAILC